MKLPRVSPRAALIAALQWCGDEAHRRAVATAVVFLAAHLLGRAFDADTVANVLDFLIAVLGGAWSRHTPDLDGAA